MDHLRTLAMRPYLPIAIIFLFLLMALLVWQLANDVPEENSNSVTATVTSTNSTAP
jgi:sensor domain CHASE-containing protein